MEKSSKTKAELIAEIETLRARIGDLELLSSSPHATGHNKVTEQDHSALSESQVLFQGILDHSPAIICILNLQGEFILANNRCLQGLGLTSLSQIITKTPADLFSPQQYELFAKDTQHLLATEASIEREIVYTRDHTQYTWLMLEFPIYDAAGSISAIGVIATDITERKRAEQALRTNEAQFRTAVENMLDGFAIFRAVRDADGTIVDFEYRYIRVC